MLLSSVPTLTPEETGGGEGSRRRWGPNSPPRFPTATLGGVATTATDGGLGEPPGPGGRTLDKRLLLSLLASAAHLTQVKMP